MANLTHFMIPADDVARAKRFYSALLGWKIDPVAAPETMGIGAMQYHEITTGPVEPGALSSGGLYKRHQKEPILSFVQVGDIEGVVSKVEMLGGKVMMPVSEIPNVGLTAMILDTEKNLIGLWSPEGHE
jgi:Predicted enzyme related to lactoylglutathione lyase